MIVPYRAFPGATKGILIHRPIIEVKLVRRSRSVSTWALLDSGADKTLINKEIGKQLGIDYKSCSQGTAMGIVGQNQKTWRAEIEIEVDGFPGDLKHSNVEFIDSANVGILLGHVGFFEFFDVKFETTRKQFEIDLATVAAPKA